jgi:pimeloyl-ACP methyl ester carboxylesterase
MKLTYWLIIQILTLSAAMNAQKVQSGHFAVVNGLKMYYEIHGNGSPFVLLHGGGSTIESNYGRILPAFSQHHQVIAVELQAHGHTQDIDRPLSFEQDADDVAELLRQLNIKKASFMGFSNGATTCLQIAIRHPEVVNKLVLASAIYQREGIPAAFWVGMQHASLESMPQPLKDSYLKANNDTAGLVKMFNRDVNRMRNFKDIADSELKNIKAPALIINGDSEMILPEHALKMYRNIPHARLAIIPGGHGEYIGEVCFPNSNSKIPLLVTAMIEEFLNQ